MTPIDALIAAYQQSPDAFLASIPPYAWVVLFTSGLGLVIAIRDAVQWVAKRVRQYED